MEEIIPGIYENSRRPEHRYLVFGIGTNARTGEETVYYLALHRQRELHNIPLTDFLELTTIEGQKTHKYRLILPIPDLQERLANSVQSFPLPK